MKAPTPSPTPNPLSEMQLKLVNAYLDLVFDEGIENVTLQKVASRAKVAFGSVRYHFVREGQPELMDAATMHVVTSGYRAIESYLQTASQSTSYNPLHAYVEAMFNWADRSRRESSYLLHFYYRCGTYTQLKLGNAQILATARQRILQLLHEAVGRGLYKAQGAQSPQIALQIHALVMGAIVIAATERSSNAFAKQKKMVIGTIDQLLGTQPRKNSSNASRQPKKQ